jgi:hypothetical protein
VELNPAAIAVSAIAAQIVSIGYYVPLTPQLAKLSAAYEDTEAAVPPPGKLLLEFVRNLVLATVVAGLSSELDLSKLVEGLGLGAILWIGFPVVLWTGAVMWEKIPPRLAAIHSGDWLIKLLLVAAIVTVWS